MFGLRAAGNISQQTAGITMPMEKMAPPFQLIFSLLVWSGIYTVSALVEKETAYQFNFTNRYINNTGIGNNLGQMYLV